MNMSWPAVLAYRRVDPELRNFTASGGRSRFGREQRVFADAGFWEIRLEIPIYKPEKVRAYRTLMAHLRAGGTVDVPVCPGYRPEGTDETAAGVSVGENAAVRSTQIELDVYGVTIADGDFYTIGSSLYLIRDVLASPAIDPTLGPWERNSPWNDTRLWTDGADPSSSYTVSILPPLRGAITSGWTVEARKPRLRCELADMNDGDLSLDLLRFGTATLTLREAL